MDPRQLCADRRRLAMYIFEAGRQFASCRTSASTQRRDGGDMVLTRMDDRTDRLPDPPCSPIAWRPFPVISSTDRARSRTAARSLCPQMLPSPQRRRCRRSSQRLPWSAAGAARHERHGLQLSTRSAAQTSSLPPSSSSDGARRAGAHGPDPLAVGGALSGLPNIRLLERIASSQSDQCELSGAIMLGLPITPTNPPSTHGRLQAERGSCLCHVRVLQLAQQVAVRTRRQFASADH